MSIYPLRTPPARSTILRKVLGIDIAKDTFEVRFGSISDRQEERFLGSATFPNEKRGFRKLLEWTKKQLVSVDVPVWFVMEAAGAYYEHLTYFLSEHHLQVVVVLPNKIKHFAKPSMQSPKRTVWMPGAFVSLVWNVH